MRTKTIHSLSRTAPVEPSPATGRAPALRHSIGATALGGALLVCALVLLGSSLPAAGTRTPVTAPGAPAADSAASPALAAVASQGAELGLSRTSLPGPVYDLTYDTTRNALWFAQMSLGGPSNLYEYRLADGALSAWALPQADYNGFVTRVRVAPDGAVWLNQLYSIVRADPSDSSISTLELAQADPDAIASALSPDNRSPGTWPAALAVEADGTVLVSRHNVTSLLRVTGTLTAGGRLQLPSGVVGPSDIADVAGVVYWATPSRVGAMSETGAPEALTGPGASRLTSAGTRVLAMGPASLQALSPAGAASLPSTAGSPNDLAVATAGGAYVWRRESASLQKLDQTGSVTAVLAFATFPVDGPVPTGVAGPMLASATITAMAVDSAGSLWCVELDGGAAYLVHFGL